MTLFVKHIYFISTVPYFIFSHNNLSNLPSGICQLKCLKSLHAEYNNLVELPDALGCLYYLEDVVSIDHIGRFLEIFDNGKNI